MGSPRSSSSPVHRSRRCAPRLLPRVMHHATGPPRLHAVGLDRKAMAGAGGFEPPNTGSKVPRLTAWPRPNTHLFVILAVPHPARTSERADRGAGDAAHRPARPPRPVDQAPDRPRVVERARQPEHRWP